MKCMQVWAFSASFWKMALWVLMLGKCPSKYTTKLVGGFYMRFNVLGPTAQGPPTGQNSGRNSLHPIRPCRAISNWNPRESMVGTSMLTNGWMAKSIGWDPVWLKKTSPSLSLTKGVVRNPRFPLLPPTYESASRTRFPRVRPPGPTHPRCIRGLHLRGRLIPLRHTSLSRGSRALQIVECIVEISIAGGAAASSEN
jgi:hypothetical protein